jgi:O-methyltransferase
MNKYLELLRQRLNLPNGAQVKQIAPLRDAAAAVRAEYAEINCPIFNSNSDYRIVYIDLLKRCLTNMIYFDSEIRPCRGSRPLRSWIIKMVNAMFFNPRERAMIISTVPVDLNSQIEGRSWPPTAHTMVGMHRLENVQKLMETVLTDDVPGDIIEAGVWRGGASILMKAILNIHGASDRTLYLADSFAGLPPPNEEKYPADRGDRHHTIPELAISLDTVQANFERYGLRDEKVKFLKGWFSESLPNLNAEKLALIRADGDMYESTTDIFTNLYPKLSVGGFVIVDDYYNIEACRQAVTDYRNANAITEEIQKVDWTGAYWRRTS